MPKGAEFLDIVMMACLTGKERTLTEFKIQASHLPVSFR